MSDATEAGAARAAAGTLLWFAAALLATACGWYAYVDAPLTNLALLLFAAATACAVIAIIAALLAIEASLTVLARTTRLRRSALLFLAVAVVLMLTSATLTLSLQGQAADQQDDTTVSA